MAKEREAGTSQPEQPLSQKELAPKVEELLKEWKQALTVSDRFKANLAQRYLSGEAHMRDYELEPIGKGPQLRVILDDNETRRWIKYSIDSGKESLMEVLEVFVAGNEQNYRQLGKQKLTIRRPFQTPRGAKGVDNSSISYKDTFVEERRDMEELNTRKALDYGQKLLNNFRASLSSSTAAAS